MTRKQWCILTAALLALSLCLVVGVVVLVDPFEIYHPAWFYQPAYSSATQAYSNAGIAKTHEYDSVIIGTSVSENCTPSVYDAALGGRFVKLCMNGGTARDHALMMETAFRTHDVAQVVYGLDLFAYSLYHTNQREATPDYLYDDNLLNDVQYWFNQSVLFSAIPDALSRMQTPNPEAARDSMYFWDPPSMPGAQALVQSANLSRAVAVQDDSARLTEFAQNNLEYNLLPFIRAHKDTQFHIFFPPYSMLYWADKARSGDFEASMAQKELLLSALIAEENVTVYDFQICEEWVLHYDLYYDLIHYTSPVNDAMAQAMAEGKFIISTQDEADAAVSRLREMTYATN